jgi:hypothetical protein
MSEFVLVSELRQKHIAEQPAIKVTTNNVPRKLSMLSELSKKDRKDFDYIYDFDKAQENQCIEACFDERLVQYRGVWYDTRDTQRIIGSPNMGRMGWEMIVDEDHPFAKWDAVISDSFFSGVLFRFVETDDGYSVICGRYYS